jgi:hypothetical protein
MPDAENKKKTLGATVLGNSASKQLMRNSFQIQGRTIDAKLKMFISTHRTTILNAAQN